VIIEIDPGAGAPPYEQICTQVVAAIRGGALPVGARLPTVRQLAGDLGLAVNTVAKAYKQLESEGHVATRGRNGTVVLPRADAAGQRVDVPAGERDAAPAEAARGDEANAAAIVLARSAQRLGLSLPEAMGLLRQAW